MNKIVFLFFALTFLNNVLAQDISNKLEIQKELQIALIESERYKDRLRYYHHKVHFYKKQAELIVDSLSNLEIETSRQREEIHLLRKTLENIKLKNSQKGQSKQLLKDAYAQIKASKSTIDSISLNYKIKKDNLLKNYEIERDSLLKCHKIILDNQKEEFAHEKMKYINYLNSFKPIELEKLSLSKLITLLTWKEFLAFLAFIVIGLGISLNIGYRLRGYLFDKEKIELYTENIHLKEKIKKKPY